MISEERIIVSLTSWYKRIGNVKTVVESLLNQTLPASKILIDLCTEDFPNMEVCFILFVAAFFLYLRHII